MISYTGAVCKQAQICVEMDGLGQLEKFGWSQLNSETQRIIIDKIRQSPQ